MSESLRLLGYQGSAEERKPEPVTHSGEPPAQEPPPWGMKAAALQAAGWDHVVRGPKKLRIWCEDAADPQKFWAGEEVAYARLQSRTTARGA